MAKLKVFHFHNGSGGGVLSVIRNLLAYAQHDEIENHVIYTIKKEEISSFKIPGLKGAAGEHLNQNQGAIERNPKMAVISKRAVTGIIGVAGLCMSLFLYKVYSANGYVAGNPYAYQSPYIFFKPYNVDSLMSVEREHAIRARLDSIDRAAKAATAKKNPPVQQKKKRKRFLGIF